jgi:hypothetical protein
VREASRCVNCRQQPGMVDSDVLALAKGIAKGLRLRGFDQRVALHGRLLVLLHLLEGHCHPCAMHGALSSKRNSSGGRHA